MKISNAKAATNLKMQFRNGNNNLTLKEIYSAYFDELFLYARSITNSSDLAKDAVSDVFMNLLNANTDLNYVRDIKSYLYKSVKNSAIKILSAHPVRLEYLQHDKEFQIAEELSPHQLMLGKELEEFVTAAIKELPPHAQLVFEMVGMKQMKYEEVAEELGISVNTVRNHLVSATKVLRQKMKEFYADDKPAIKLSNKLGFISLLASLLHIFQ